MVFPFFFFLGEERRGSDVRSRDGEDVVRVGGWTSDGDLEEGL